MSQVQFGVWCAISIHDTSSVIAAAALFGDDSAQIAIILKLVRILWLTPYDFCWFGENRQILGLVMVCHILRIRCGSRYSAEYSMSCSLRLLG